MKDNQKKILKMRKGGAILTKVMARAINFVQPGMTLFKIDQFIEEEIKSKGAQPSFKMVPGYKWASCINLNAGVVHGVPDQKKIKKGDLVSLDIGVFYQGYHTDAAYTWEIKTNNFSRFLAAGKQALKAAIKKAKAGNRVADISSAIQEEIEGKKIGYCSRELTGHGVGTNLHRLPIIPCFLSQERKKTPILKENETLAIEIIYSQKKSKIKVEPDGWTIVNINGKISALFEKTVLVTTNGGFELTPFLWEK